jgi:hypothetical protein
MARLGGTIVEARLIQYVRTGGKTAGVTTL